MNKNYKILIIASFLCLETAVQCAAKSGIISQDAVWQGEVAVTGDVVIQDDVTLTIMPGTVVRIDSRRSDYDYMIMKPVAEDMTDILNDNKCDIVVRGKLKAEGKEGNKIVFESGKSDREEHGQWGGIFIFGNGNDSVIDNAVINNAKISIFCWDGSKPTIKYCTIAGNDYGIVALDSSAPEVADNVIKENKYGIAVYDTSTPEIRGNRINRVEKIGIGTRGTSSPRMTNNVIKDNDIGICCGDKSNPEIFKNEISGNRMGISLLDKATPRILENIISQNDEAGINIRDSANPWIKNNTIEMNTDGILYSLSSNPEMNGNVFKDNKEELKISSEKQMNKVSGILNKSETWEKDVFVEGDIIVPAGMTLTIKPGARITFKPNNSISDQSIVKTIDGNDVDVAFVKKCDIIVHGTIVAEGSETLGIKIGNPSPVSESGKMSWGSIIILGNGEGSVIRNVTVEYGSVGISCWDDTKIKIEGSMITNNKIGIDCSLRSVPEISGCTVKENDTYGIVCRENAAPAISGCDIVKNGLIGIGITDSSMAKVNKNNVRENMTGIDCTGSCVPHLINNVISNNDKGMGCYEESIPHIYENEFSRNKTALFIKDRSYPKLRNNNFIGNTYKIIKD